MAAAHVNSKHVYCGNPIVCENSSESFQKVVQYFVNGTSQGTAAEKADLKTNIVSRCSRLPISEISNAGLGQILLIILPKNELNLSSELLQVKLKMKNCCTTSSEASFVLQCHRGCGEMPRDNEKDKNKDQQQKGGVKNRGRLQNTCV